MFSSHLCCYGEAQAAVVIGCPWACGFKSIAFLTKSGKLIAPFGRFLSIITNGRKDFLFVLPVSFFVFQVSQGWAAG